MRVKISFPEAFLLGRRLSLTKNIVRAAIIAAPAATINGSESPPRLLSVPVTPVARVLPTEFTKVSREVAECTGLAEGTPISTGTGDQQCAAVGAGVVEPGFAELTLGTSGVLVVATEKPVLPESGIMMVPASGAWGLYEVE